MPDLIKDLLAVHNPLTLKLALFIGAFLVAASSALVRKSIAQPLLTSIQNSPGVMHATAAVTAFHRLKIDSASSVRTYALSNIPALIIGACLAITGLLGLALPSELLK